MLQIGLSVGWHTYARVGISKISFSEEMYWVFNFRLMSFPISKICPSRFLRSLSYMVEECVVLAFLLITPILYLIILRSPIVPRLKNLRNALIVLDFSGMFAMHVQFT